MDDFIETKPSEEQLTKVKTLGALLDWGAEKIRNDELFDRHKSAKQRVLYALMIAVHNYSESICTLLKEGRTNTAELIWRSLFESWVNYMYVLACDDDRNAMEFMMSSDFENQKMSRLLAEFIEKPEHAAVMKKKNDSLLTTRNQTLESAKIRSAMAERQVGIDEEAQKYSPPISDLRGLKDRMIAIDKYKSKNELGYDAGSMEFEYLTTYSYASDPAHLKPLGIFRLYNFHDDGTREIHLSGDLSKIEGLVRLTYVIYLTFISEFAKEFAVATEQDLEPFNSEFERLAE